MAIETDVCTCMTSLIVSYGGNRFQLETRLVLEVLRYIVTGAALIVYVVRWHVSKL